MAADGAGFFVLKRIRRQEALVPVEPARAPEQKKRARSEKE